MGVCEKTVDLMNRIWRRARRGMAQANEWRLSYNALYAERDRLQTELTECKATVAKEIAARRRLMQALINALLRAHKAEAALGQIAACDGLSLGDVLDIACNALRPVATAVDAPHQLHDG